MSAENLIFSPECSEEDRFAYTKCYFRMDRRESWPEILVSIDWYVDHIKRNWPGAPAGIPGIEATYTIIEAVKDLGVAAIHYDEKYSPYRSALPAIESDPSPLSLPGGYTFRPGSNAGIRHVSSQEPRSAWEELNQLVSAAIATWQWRVTVGHIRPFLWVLQQIATALIPAARGKGKKKSAWDSQYIRFWYYKMFIE